MSDLKLYTFWRSSAAYRARIALNIKGLSYAQIPKHLRNADHKKADYVALNPQGLIPALAIGEQVIGQSLAIIEYLDETRPSPPLLPVGPEKRAIVRSMAHAIACDIHPINNLRVLNFLKNNCGQTQEGVDSWARHWISEGFRGLEIMARAYSSQERFCFGDTVTMADICLVPQVYNASRVNTDLAPYPMLMKINSHLLTLKPFMDARPEVQPDAEK